MKAERFSRLVERAVDSMREDQRLQPPMSSDEIERLEESIGIPFPARLKEMLEQSVEWLLFQGKADMTIADLEVSHADGVKSYQSLTGEAPPEEWLFFATDSTGDMFVADTSDPTDEGDCSVVLVDHETGDIIDDWAGIGELLGRLVALTQKDEDSDDDGDDDDTDYDDEDDEYDEDDDEDEDDN